MPGPGGAVIRVRLLVPTARAEAAQWKFCMPTKPSDIKVAMASKRTEVSRRNERVIRLYLHSVIAIRDMQGCTRLSPVRYSFTTNCRRRSNFEGQTLNSQKEHLSCGSGP